MSNEYRYLLLLINILHYLEHDPDNEVARKEFIYEIQQVEQAASQPKRKRIA